MRKSTTSAFTAMKTAENDVIAAWNDGNESLKSNQQSHNKIHFIKREQCHKDEYFVNVNNVVKVIFDAWLHDRCVEYSNVGKMSIPELQICTNSPTDSRIRRIVLF